MVNDIKNITVEEFEAQARNIVFDVMACGDIVRVDCGESGRFVIMDELVVEERLASLS